MADANVIAGEHPMSAAWKKVFGLQAEASSLLQLAELEESPAPVAILAASILQRVIEVTEELESVERECGMCPLTHWQTGGMGAMAPMVTKVVDSQLDQSRT